MLDELDDHVLECILSKCTSKTVATLACVSRRFAPLVKRRMQQHGICMSITNTTIRKRMAYCHKHNADVRTLYCRRIPLWKLALAPTFQRLEVLILKRTTVDLRSILRLQALRNLKRLEVQVLTRDIDQQDRLLISYFPETCVQLRVVVDDMWNAVIVDDCMNIRNLEIVCRKTGYLRQTYVIVYDIKGLERLCIRAHDRIGVHGIEDASDIRTLIIHCGSIRMCRSLYKLIGPRSKHVEFLLPRVNVLVWDIQYKSIEYMKLMASQIILKTLGEGVRYLHLYGKYISTRDFIPSHVRHSIIGIRCRYPELVYYGDL